jgi:cytochrome c oxidase subunit 4
MAGRLLFSSLRQVQKLQKACVHGRSRIGSREVVGFGFNGQCSYQDRVDFPMPAIRFKENTPDLTVSKHILNIECIRLRINSCLHKLRIMQCQNHA